MPHFTLEWCLQLQRCVIQYSMFMLLRGIIMWCYPSSNIRFNTYSLLQRLHYFSDWYSCYLQYWICGKLAFLLVSAHGIFILWCNVSVHFICFHSFPSNACVRIALPIGINCSYYLTIFLARSCRSWEKDIKDKLLICL